MSPLYLGSLLGNRARLHPSAGMLHVRPASAALGGGHGSHGVKLPDLEQPYLGAYSPADLTLLTRLQ
jgi:hypothetical protein